MKYKTEYRNKKIINYLIDEIHRVSKKSAAFMEVCGGHTNAIQQFGIPSLLPENIHLLSGPGCPVCVTDKKFIDQAIALSRLPDVIISTFGDLIRVPGSLSSLEKERADGADVRIVYSILDAITIAKQETRKKVVFLGIGFETTTPGSAVGVLEAEKEKLSNFFLLSSHKVMPPAMKALIDEGVKIDGYIAPGHVSTITGSSIYNDIPEKFGLGCVISGFEPVDLLETILKLVVQHEENCPKVEIQYKRAVKPEGNLKAKKIIDNVFEPKDDWWRGLGVLKDSGLRLKEKYRHFDAERNFDIVVPPTKEDKGCICGSILKGINNPKECSLFAKKCTPENPVGTCMVSPEGACQAFYKYNR